MINRRSFLQTAALAPIAAMVTTAEVHAYPETVDDFPPGEWDVAHRFVMTQSQARRIAKATFARTPGLISVEKFYISDKDWTDEAIAALSEVA